MSALDPGGIERGIACAIRLKRPTGRRFRPPHRGGGKGGGGRFAVSGGASSMVGHDVPREALSMAGAVTHDGENVTLSLPILAARGLSCFGHAIP